MSKVLGPIVTDENGDYFIKQDRTGKLFPIDSNIALGIFLRESGLYGIGKLKDTDQYFGVTENNSGILGALDLVKLVLPPLLTEFVKSSECTIVRTLYFDDCDFIEHVHNHHPERESPEKKN